METLHREKHRLRQQAYLAGFFLNLSVALAAYINSSFLERFVSEHTVGLLYALGALISLIGSVNLNHFTRKFGNRRGLIWLTILDLVALAGIISYGDSALAIIFLVLNLAASYLISVNLDLYLENISENSVTGGIRGLFLSLSNLAWLLSPLLSSYLLATGNYGYVYLTSGLALLPFFYLITRLKHFDPPEYQASALPQTLKRIWRGEDHKDANLKKILQIDFLLNFFYAVMVIYLPIYLVNHIGLSWSAVGTIFTIMLLPFVLLDFGLGRLADRLTGEKEILIGGLIVTGIATGFLTLMTTSNIWFWGAALFMTRVGAASVEIMKETYLFKQIDSRDINAVFLSRNTYPLAYIIAPVLASLFLLVFPFRFLFLALGLLMFLGLPVSLKLRDTR